MYRLLVIFLFFCSALKSQDKLYFLNGKVKEGVLVSMGKDFIFFRNSDTSMTRKIPKTELILIEDVRGVRHIISNSQAEKNTSEIRDTTMRRKNTLGMQPFSLLWGRATFIYEYLNDAGTVGFVFPLTITFDPFGTIYKLSADTSANAIRRINGINFIGGADVNFYLGKNEEAKFFCGPRARYGTDIFLRNLEGYSLQTQFGWKLSGPRGRFVQHISVGFGFARVLSIASTRVANPKQSYGWYSVNYRLGISW